MVAISAVRLLGALKLKPDHAARIFFRPSSSAASSPLPLPRSINPSKGLLLLRVPVAPTDWPAKLELASPLVGATNTKYKRHGIAVNAVWDGIGRRKTFDEKERYSVELYRPGKRAVAIDGYSIGDGRVLDALNSQGEDGIDEQQEILVCTHGARDCRCADQGVPLVKALEKEIKRLGLDERIRVSEVAHVGGHKYVLRILQMVLTTRYAANAILMPSMDMLSNLGVEHAPAIIKHLRDGAPDSSPMWAHWRGRYGHTEEEQKAIWQATQKVSAEGTSPAISGSAGMVELVFKTFEGDERRVHAKIGESLLEIAKREDLPAMEGVCGGHLGTWSR